MMPPAPAPTAAPVPLSVAHPAPAISDAPITMDINFVVISRSGAAHVPAGGRAAERAIRTIRTRAVPIARRRARHRTPHRASCRGGSQSSRNRRIRADVRNRLAGLATRARKVLRPDARWIRVWCPAGFRTSRPAAGRFIFELRGIRSSHSGKHLAVSARMHLHPLEHHHLVVDHCVRIPPWREHAQWPSNQARSCTLSSAVQARRLVFELGEV
jgi:hypothetical protein